MERANVFLSYAREDQETALRLQKDLQREGISVWIDLKNLRPGENWKHAITRAIEQSTHFLALISSRSLGKKGFVQKELRIAFEVVENLPPDYIFIVPVRIDDCEPKHRFLIDLNWADLFPSYKDGFSRVLRVLKPQTTTTAVDIPLGISDRCPRCGEEVGLTRDRCKVCWTDVGAPNVRSAFRERTTLDKRYQTAVERAIAEGYEERLRVFEVIANKSTAVMNMNLAELLRLLQESDSVYSNYYELSNMGAGLSKDDRRQRSRRFADETLFPGYSDVMLFAALTIEGQGLSSYGEVAVRLDERFISHRTTVLDSSAIQLINRWQSLSTSDIPFGFRSVFEERHKLAVAKVSDRLGSVKTEAELARLFFENGARDGHATFMEVNIFGTINKRAIRGVQLRRFDTGVEEILAAAAKELAIQAGIEWSEIEV